MSTSRGLKKMANSDCSLEPMEVDLRAADMSIRPSRHAIANNVEGTMDLTTRRRNRNSDSSIVQSQPADLSGHRRNSMDTLLTSDQRSRDRPVNNNSVPSRSRPNSVGGTRYSAELSNHRRHSRSSNSSSSAIMQQISHQQQQPTNLMSDVIILSDEEAPRINGHVNGFSTDSHPDSPESDLPEPLTTSNQAQPSKVARLTPEERVKKELSLRRLQEELRNEEMKLVLLKKLRQSQLVKETLITPPAAVQQGPVVTSSGKMSGVAGGRTSSPNVSVGGSNNLLSRSSGKMHSHQSQSLHQSMNQSQSQSMGSSSRSGSNSLPPSIMLQQNMLRNSGLLGRTPVTTPPNVVMGYPMQSSQGSKTSASHNSSSSTQQPSSTSSPTPQQISGQLAQAAERMETQTPAQRQAAAKLALRKQLEKTLLQIPPPKPPPPEMHFIPNANNQEFVYLVGLEVVVGLLVGDERSNKPPPDPFTCVQCATDFTPVWKWQDAGEKKKPPAVICESCVTTNIKKALKAEHTNRLKTAFVKALQQEQEIEQRMSQGSTTPPLPISTPPPPVITTSSCAVPSSAINHRASTPPNSHSPVPSSYSRSGGGGGSGALGASSAAAANAVAAAVANSAALLQQMPKLTAAHQSILQAQHLQQLAQSLPGHPPQPAHMLPFGPLLAAQAYSYQMLGKSSLSSSDLQRQYLLDMIPPRSMSQNSMNWKT